jgi:hypothetical protein
MTRRAALVVTLLALLVAACGCQDPYSSQPSLSSPSPTRSRKATPGDTSRPGPRIPPLTPATARGSRSPRRAARSFAARWVNWDWRTVADQQRSLARLATGSLAQRLRADGGSARIDASLARDRPGSRGAVAAIDLRTAGDRASGVVVTRELSYTGGRTDLGGRRYRVYLIRLSRGRNGWEVSAWQPQP